MRLWVLAALIGSLAVPVLADAVPRPMPRPIAVTPLASVSGEQKPAARAPLTWTVIRPRSRPAQIVFSTPVAQPAAVVEAQPAAVVKAQPAATVEPVPKPKRKGLGIFKMAAVKSKPGRSTTASKKGSVCGDPAIKGEVMAPIVASVKGCGVAEPVRVTSVSGVRLSQSATIDCTTARALKDWVDNGLQPAFGRTEVVELRVAAHYICRSRNNVKGAKISEHGRGKAIDIAGVVLENGQTVTVLGGYDKTMRKAYKAACGVFGTTLGPGSDGYHEDHMHFDTASHRSGPYCR